MEENSKDNSSQKPSRNGNGNNIEEKLSIGDVIGGCELQKLIGKGGMGAVFKARQRSLDKTVAIKVLSPRYWKDRVFIENFVTEARIAAKIDHQNVVQVFDTGLDNGIPYILMQFVSGKTLRQKEKERNIPFSELLDYFIQATKGLLSAHSQKVVHRDIKPENLIITLDGSLKITDFGLAKHEKDIPDDLPKDGKIMASASFMSPEQADLHPIDIRSDLYSLGVTFYSLFTGVKPFCGNSHLEFVLRHHLDQPLCATLQNRDIPLSLSAILNKLMRKRPSFRYQSANDLLIDLDKIKAGQYPRTEQNWRFESFAVSKVDASTIVKSGVSVCIRSQKDSKKRNEPFSNLGEMMHAKDFVKIIKPSVKDKKMPEDLQFLIPKNLKIPKTTKKTQLQIDASEISLTEFIAKPELMRDENGIPNHTLKRAPIDVDFVGKTLILYFRDIFTSELQIQHFYDLLDHFPYPFDYTVRFVFEDDVKLVNADIRWLIEAHNLINRKKGSLNIKILSSRVEDFFERNNLDDFIDIDFDRHQKIEESFMDYSDIINAVVDEVVEEVDIIDENSQIEIKSANKVEVIMNEKNKNEKKKNDEIIDELALTDDESEKMPVEDLEPVEDTENVKSDVTEHGLKIQEKINLGDFDGAFRLAKKFIITGKGITPDIDEVFSKIARKFKFEGEELMKKNEFSKAKELFEKAIEIRNADADSYLFKGLCLKKLGKLTSAIEFINAAIDLNPNNANFYYNRAIIKSRLKNAADAISDLSKAIEINPNHANAFYNRGIAFEKKKEFANALSDFKKALNLNPDYRKILTPRLKKIAIELEKKT
ncbi:MAG: protein kinase [Planctomycetes bacterium]|nr:protein kinase [Planctomycetota bacterium]